MKKIFDMRFANQVIIIVGISTALFIIAQFVSFLITKQEQAELIRWYFTAVVIQCGVMMMKRVTEVIVARVKKKEKLGIPPPSDSDNTEEIAG